MSFSPSTIGQGGVSRLTYRLENGAAVAAAEVALSDRLPADVVLAPELNADRRLPVGDGAAAASPIPAGRL